MNPITFLHRQLSYFIGMPEDRTIQLVRTNRRASPTFSTERAQIMLRRIEVLAWVFMIVVPLWILVDAQFFPSEVVISLATGRVAAAVFLATLLMISLVLVKRPRGGTAYMTLLILMAIPALFGVYAQSVFHAWQLHHDAFSPGQSTAYEMYQYLPVIYVAGLALFPLTLIESLPIILAFTATMAYMDMLGSSTGMIGISDIPMLWTLLVIGATACLAGVLQFNLLWENHRLRTTDEESGLMNRKAALDTMQEYWDSHPTRPVTLGMITCDKEQTGYIGVQIAALKDQVRTGLWAVRWSDTCLGVMGIGHDRVRIQQWLDSLDLKPVDGAAPRISVAERHGDHAISPQNLVTITERKLHRQQRHAVPAGVA